MPDPIIFPSVDAVKAALDSGNFDDRLMITGRARGSGQGDNDYCAQPLVGEVKFTNPKITNITQIEKDAGVVRNYEVNRQAEIYGGCSMFFSNNHNTISGKSHVEVIDLSTSASYADKLNAYYDCGSVIDKVVTDIKSLQPKLLIAANSITGHAITIKVQYDCVPISYYGIGDCRSPGKIIAGGDFGAHDFNDNALPDHLIGFVVGADGKPTHAVIVEDQ